MSADILKNILKIFFLTVVLCPFFCGLSRAEDESKGVTAGGVVFNIASDRQVKKIGGIVQPEPLDLYLKRLLDSISERLERIEKKVDAAAADLQALKMRPPAANSAPALSLIRVKK